MVNRSILFLALFALLFSLAFASAAYYGSRILSSNDIYWARDYYASDAYQQTRTQTHSSQQTYSTHQTTQSYYDSFYRSHSTAPRVHHRGISANYLYYSPTFNRYQIKRCHIVPPSNQLIYVRC